MIEFTSFSSILVYVLVGHLPKSFKHNVSKYEIIDAINLFVCFKYQYLLIQCKIYKITDIIRLFICLKYELPALEKKTP